LQVDVDYFGALEAQALWRVAQHTFDTRQMLLNQVSAYAARQLRSELDVSFAQVSLEEARLLVQRAQNDTDAALTSLSTALGFRELKRFQLLEPPSPAQPASHDVSALIGTALHDRPDLARLRDERDAALRLAKAERGLRYPTIAAIGEVGNSPIHDDRLPDNYAAAAVTLTLPLFTGGLYSARQHEAELRAQAASETLRTEEDNAIRDVRVAWLNVTNARERLRTTEQLVKHAAQAYQLADARYKNGISSIVELSQADLSLTAAQIANTNARYDVLIQQSALDYQTAALH
jgi:outer membrane protein